ncbi:MAG: hypothetical protein NVS4B11_37640 [Ktedonobacteraceae bacterium]
MLVKKEGKLWNRSQTIQGPEHHLQQDTLNQDTLSQHLHGKHLRQHPSSGDKIPECQCLKAQGLLRKLVTLNGRHCGS